VLAVYSHESVLVSLTAGRAARSSRRAA